MRQQEPLLPETVDIAVTVAAGQGETLVCIHIRFDKEEVVHLRLTADETKRLADQLLRATQHVARLPS